MTCTLCLSPVYGDSPAHQSIQAVEIEAGSGKLALGEDEPAPLPDHPPLSEIPPMPMPQPSELVLKNNDPGMAAFMDRESGESGLLPAKALLDRLPQTGGGFRGVDGGPGEEPLDKGFGTMSSIADPSIFPWRMNVKVVMRFETNTGADAFFVCSGSMIDAETVITAGHCVFSRRSDIMDWAEEIWIYPGWSGDSGTFGGPNGARVEPFGFGRSTSFSAFTGWTANGNFDWDAGLIRLTRAVGMLTGWYGWAWGFDCSTIQGRFYFNASFPSEGCGSPGLHNGRDMLVWTGDFDSCPGNQLQIDTTAGCMTALWGGQSGSGAYYFAGSTRVVHGIASNSNRTTVGRYAKLWENFINHMNDTFIPTSRGTTFDLQALNTNGPALVTAGQPLTGSNVLTTNPTNATAASTGRIVRVYLSTNDNISTGDTLLSTQSYTSSYGTMSSVTVNLAGMNVPIGTPSGSYFLGTILDSAVDGNSSNNDTDGWDAHPIIVQGVSDLLADSVRAPSGTFREGDILSVSYQIRNQGGDFSASPTVEIRISSNSIISTADTLVDSLSFLSVGGGGILSRTRNIVLPSLADGTYFIGIRLVIPGDANSANNTLADLVPITVTSSIFTDGFESGNLSVWSGSVP